MIPLISILNLVNFAVPIFLSVRTYLAYRTSRSLLLLHLSLASFLFSFYWLFGSAGIVFNDLYDISVINVLRFVFLYMALIFIVQIPFSLIAHKFLGFMGGILDFYFTYAISTIFVTTGLLILADGIMHEHKHAIHQTISPANTQQNQSN